MSASTGVPDLDRVVEIEYTASGENPSRGSGYLIAAGLVLTARHVVLAARRDPKRVRVRPASSTDEDGWTVVREVVPARGADLDMALLLLETSAQVEDTHAETLKLGCIDVAAPTPFHACGFPTVHRVGDVRDTETARGSLRPDARTRARGAVLVLDVSSGVPAARDLASIALAGTPRSGWSGMSGAAVIGPGGLLVGVLTEADVDFVATRLHAAPITALLADEALSPRLPESWRVEGEQGMRRLSNELTVSVGSRHRVVLTAPGRSSDAAAPHGRRPVALLTAKTQTVPFIPREEPQRLLRAWCEADATVSFAVLSGEGGAGKSRLAAELCTQLVRSGWAAGVARPDDGTPADLGLEEIGRPVLLVVDYADHLQGYVAELLSGAATRGTHKVRILAIVRDGRAFLRRFSVEVDADPAAFDAEREIWLGRTPLSGEEREAHYRAAAAAFRDKLRIGDLPDPADDDLRKRLDAMPTPLLVHARALLDVLDRDNGRLSGTDLAEGTLPPENQPAETSARQSAGHAADSTAEVNRTEAAHVLRELLEREDERYWEPLFGTLLTTKRARRSVFALSTLLGADTEVEALDALAATAVSAAATESDRRRLLEWIQDRYGEDRLLPLVEPDLLGEQLIADTLLARSAVGAVFDRVASPAQQSRALEVLLHMCGSPVGSLAQSARAAVAELIDSRLDSLVEQAIKVTAPEEALNHDARQLASRLASCVELVDARRAAGRVAMAVEFPQRIALQPLVAAIYRNAAEWAAAEHDGVRAASFAVRTATALTTVGRFDAALTPLQQAMTHLETVPTYASSPELARVLSAGSAVSLGRNRPVVAVQDAERAVEIVEDLARREPGAHTALLVDSRLGLINAYLCAGRRRDAELTADRALAQARSLDPNATMRVRVLAAQTQLFKGDLNGAAQFYRDGIDEIPQEQEAHHPLELAALWISMAVVQANLGQLDEARADAQNAERFALIFAMSGVDEAQFVLAQVRLGAATVAAAAEDYAEALSLVEHAREELFGLYREAEDVYGVYYGICESFYARVLCAVGQFEEARQAARRGVNAARVGFASSPLLYLPALVDATIALANVHAVAEDFTGATVVIEEVLGRVERLETAVAPRAVEFRALLLRVLADIELAKEVSGDAVQRAQRAVEAYSSLVSEHDPAGYLVHLVGARLLLIKALVESDRGDESVEAAQQAQQVLSDALRLNSEAPNDQSRRILAMARYIVADSYGSSGDVAAAMALLHTALDEFVLDRETGGDAEDRELLREAIRELESSAAPRRLLDTPPPTQFADLTPGQHRVVLGRFEGEDVAAREFRPVLVLGPQRSRKTTALITPTLLDWQGPALVTSVRADVVLGSVRRRSRMGEVSIFEPTGSLFCAGNLLTSWNPVDGCEDWETAVGMAYALTESARGGEDGSGLRDERYWYQQACLLLQPLLHAAALSRLNMEAVSQWIRTGARAEVLARLHVGAAREAVDLFRSFSQLVDATRDGVYATARNVLRAYESTAVRRASRTRFSPREFFNGKSNTLYLCAPPEDQERLAPIFTALIRSVITQAYRWQGDDLNLLLLLDEAGNIAKIDNLDTVATTAAGTRIQLVTVFHDISQIESVYGPSRAASIVNNHSALLILPGSRDSATMDLTDRIFADERGKGIPRRSVRQLKPGSALCVYEHLPIKEIVLRSATHDPGLIKKARDGHQDDDVSDLIVTSRRN